MVKDGVGQTTSDAINKGPGPPPPPAPPPPPMGNIAAPSSNHFKQPMMKRVHWNKINPLTLDNSSFWVGARDENLLSEDIFQSLRENFSTKMGKKETTDQVEQVRTSKKAKELKVLDHKAGQNLSILLGYIKVPYGEIKRRILEMDEAQLSADVIEQLLKYMPEPDALNQLAGMADQYDSLAEPEQFWVTISSIKKIAPRLNAMLFKMRFTEQINDIKPDLVNASEACEEATSSQRFQLILKLILELGNYLNKDSKEPTNAQSEGFDINFLTGEYEGPGREDNSAETKYPDCIGFPEEISHLDKAARVSEENLQKNIKLMEKQLKTVETDLKSLKNSAGDGDRFQDVMNQFIGSAKEQFEVLSTMHKKLESLYKDLGKFYAFEPSKYSLEEFFHDIKVFKDSFQLAMKDNQKIRRAKEAKEKSEKEKQARLARKRAIVDITTDSDTGSRKIRKNGGVGKKSRRD